MLETVFDVVPCLASDLGGFLDVHEAAHRDLPPGDRALCGGAMADRLGFAFVAGYHAAMAALIPDAGRRPALCVTEAGPPHPRSIATTLASGRLTGDKRYVTAGPLADRLWVLASTGWDGEHNRLSLVEIAPDAPGVQFVELSPLPMVPEVPHAAVKLDGVVASGRELHDAWSAYTVPFRTLEDLHVLLAATGYRLAAARRADAAPEPVEELLLVASGLLGLVGRPATSPIVHRALAGLVGLAHRAFEAAPLPSDEAERWSRDAAVLQIASKARHARLEAARRATDRSGDGAVLGEGRR